MKEIKTEIIIRATTEKVWSVLTDFAAYPAWNPFIRQITGDLKEGANLTVTIQPPQGRAMIFRPTILTATANKELRWLGNFIVPGIFDGEHCFHIEPQENNPIRFVQTEKFSGLLSGMAFRFIQDSTEQGFRTMNNALKARCET